MVLTDRVIALFADARVLYGDALEMLAQGKTRTRLRRPGERRSGPPASWSWNRTGEGTPGHRVDHGGAADAGKGIGRH